ncbi:hypothetical protein V6N13_020537 [Hibiscus sabdariffa]
MLLLGESEVLERPRSPVPDGIQPLQKKGRSMDIPPNEKVMLRDEGLHESSQGRDSQNPMSGMGVGVQIPAMPSSRGQGEGAGSKGDQ